MTVASRARPAAAIVAALVVLSGCSAAGATPAPEATGIGEWPTFLPTPIAEEVAHGSPSNPAMSFAGSPVVVAVEGAELTVDVEGPSYPADTKLGADRVACTFTVTLGSATTPIELTGARFDLLDHSGGIHALTVVQGTSIPRTLNPGQGVQVKLRTTVPSGEGFVRFYPAGSAAAAGWDYVAETD
ncbi:MAG TPA: hypothetical protein VGK53_09000 [Propionicimonas sp.]